jgi:hypothetical protein
MNASVRNRLLILGVVWGVLLAAVPAIVMADRPGGFLIAALACAAASGAVGTLAAGGRAARTVGSGALLSGLGTGFLQGLIGGGLAAIQVWAIMAVSISGLTLADLAEVSRMMRPGVFLGATFVALSAFLYALAGGLLLGPAFGVIVNRTARG